MSRDERDDEMTPELAAGLRGLRRELAPSDLLEERVVRALKTRGLLAPRRAWGRPARWTAAAAAALALFFSGLMVGQRTAAPPVTAGMPPAVVPAPPQRPATPVVEQVRQTGTAYVQAMSALKGAGSDEVKDQGREVAIDSLLAAAGELSRAHQDDPALTRALRALREADEARAPLASTPRQTFWF